MKTDWSNWPVTLDPTTISSDRYATITANTISTSNDIYDAIRYGIERKMEMEEKKARGVVFEELAKELKEMGIFLTEIRQDSFNEYAEIVASIDWINCNAFLEKKNKPKYLDPPAMKKDSRPHPKRVIFSGPATTILWMDGTKTTVKCQKEDVWSDEVGIAMCYLKKLLGNEGNYNNIFREAMKVAVVQTKKEDLTASTANEGESYYSSALDNMRQNIDEINDFMKDAVDALDKVLGGKK